MEIAYPIALGYVSIVALGRVTGILVLKIRQSRYAKRAAALPTTWRDRCTVPEPYLLGVVTLTLALVHDAPAALSTVRAAGLGASVLLALVAMVLMLWVLRAFPSVSTGHYILPEHPVVSNGPYGLVRHPLYLAAFLIWLSLALFYWSAVVLAITLVYVIPGYLIYMRSEEEMLLANLGEPYRRYRDRVGMLFPHLGRRQPQRN